MSGVCSGVGTLGGLGVTCMGGRSSVIPRENGVTLFFDWRG